MKAIKKLEQAYYMKTTIKNIADACNLSITSVSLVLNGKPNRISEETKELILKTAKKMNYRPNPNAVGLARGKTKTIGLIITDIGNMFLSETSRVIETEFRKYGYTLLLGNTGDHAVRELEYLQEFIGKNVEGIILFHASDGSEEIERQIKRLITEGDIPVVMLDNDMEDLDVIRCLVDNERGGYMATRHLLERGHTKIGSLLGPMGQYSVRSRLRGYRRALEEAGILYDEKYLYEGDFTINTGIEALPYFLDLGVTAIFAYNDMMAYGVLQYAKDHGIRIGRDLALIGYDDSFINSLLGVTLSSVRQPRRDVAQMAAKCLVNVIKNGKIKKKRIMFEPVLCERESTQYCVK